MKILNKTTLAIAVAVGSISSANAAAIIYESFSQTTGDLNGKASSGIGLTGNWSDAGTVTVEGQDLVYGDLSNTGNQATLISSGSTQAFVTTSSALGDAGLLDDGGTLWFSYIYTAAIDGGSNEKSGFAFGTERLAPDFSGTLDLANSGNAVGLVTSSTALTAATWNGTDPTTGGSIGFDPGDIVFVVGRIDWGATGADNETITLYNPSLTDLGTLGTSVSHTLTAVNQTLFDTVSMAQRNSGGDQTYDEIRFGATYADVSPIQVPEPSTTALIGLGGLALILRRRK